MVERTVRVARSGVAAEAERSTLLVYGFLREDLDEGLRPARGIAPVFLWQDLGRRDSWPVEFVVGLPDDEGVVFLAVLDVDLDGRMGPGDYLSGPVELASSGVLDLLIDQKLFEPTERSDEGWRR